MVADVRNRILSTATRLFGERGYAATSIQTIAEAVGIRRPTLVYHFGSKERLRAEVLAAVMAHWQEELPRLMLAATGGGPRLDSLLQAMFVFFLEDRTRARLLLRETLDHPEEMRALFAERLRPWTRLLTEAIRVGQSQGVIRQTVDPEAYTLTVISTALGIIAIGDSTAALLSIEPTIEAQLEELVRIARASLFVPHPAPEA